MKGADAFRHSLWNALMTYHTGKSYAKRMATAHESGSTKALETSMDLYNNDQGRTIGAQSYTAPSEQMNLLLIKTNVLSAVKGGTMKRFVGSDIGTLTQLVATNKTGLK